MKKNDSIFVLMRKTGKYFITTLFISLLLTGCSGWFGPSHYPDLNRVEVNAKREADSLHARVPQSHAERRMASLKKQIPQKVQGLAEIFLNQRGGPVMKEKGVIPAVSKKVFRIPAVRKLSKMETSQNEPSPGLKTALIVIICLCFVFAMIFLPQAIVQGEAGCFLLCIAVALLTGLVLLLFSL